MTLYSQLHLMYVSLSEYHSVPSATLDLHCEHPVV